MRSLLITCDAGFIGSNFVFDWLAESDILIIINIDKLIYAAPVANLTSLLRETFGLQLPD